jgi:Mrp family chromosome partitioning ATPase
MARAMPDQMRTLPAGTMAPDNPAGPLEPVVRQLTLGANPGWGTLVGVTSTLPEEGATAIARDLALALCETVGDEHSVLFIDWDLAPAAPERGPGRRQHEWLMALSRSSLVYRNRQALHTEGLNLRGPWMRATGEVLRKRHTFTVIDLPPLTVQPIAAEIAPALDSLYLVVRAGVARAATIEQALAGVGRERLTGVILTDVRRGPPRWLARLVS